MRAQDEVRSLDGRIWAAVGDGELVELVEQVAALEAQLAAVRAEALVEVDTRAVPRRRLRWASTSDWLAHATGCTKSHATRTLRHAHDLLGDRGETLQALRSGAVSSAQAAVVADAIADLPGDRMLRRRAERTLLEEAARLDATDLSKVARRIADTVDPDREDRKAEAELAREEREAHARRFFSLSDDGAGGVRLHGRGTLEDAAVLRAALLPLTQPEPSTDPETGEERELDPRDHGARMWDALVRMAQHAIDTTLPPESHGTPTRVAVTVDLADLVAGLGAQAWGSQDGGGRSARTDDGLDLAPGAVRRMACDAEIIPVVLGTGSAVLDVGHSHRTVTPAIWRALVVRDRHCALPGCSRPPVMCHAHHVTHWADGGETSVGNLVLVCGHHHRTVHHTPWRVRISSEDHAPEFLPPPALRTNVTHGAEPLWVRHRPRRE
jgi:hypothetical protein